jgi:hypothetical protein
MVFKFTRSIQLHRITWGVVLFCFMLFSLLNFMQQRYIQRLEDGWHGGLRMGFPAAWWDGGHRWELQPGGTLEMFPFGGVQQSGVIIDLLAFLAATTLASGACEFLLRKFLKSRREEFPVPRARAAHAITSVIAMLVVVVFVGLNLEVRTTADSESGQFPVYRQQMGFPLVTYEASDPVLTALDKKFNRKASVAEALLWLEENPGARYARSHWFKLNIVINIMLALGVVLMAALGSEWWMKRKAVHTG